MEDARKNCKKKSEEESNIEMHPCFMFCCPYMAMMMNQARPGQYAGMMHQAGPGQYPGMMNQAGPGQYLGMMHQDSPGQYAGMMHQDSPGQYAGMMNQRGDMRQQCSGFIYTVRAGDTLYSIAQRYRVSLNDLIAANPITNPNNLVIGQTLCVPGVTPLPTPVECTDGEIYTVRPGDTLNAIARRFNVTPADILAVNPIITNPNNLVVGWNLCIPTEEPTPPECEGESYTIRPGDTLFAIARRFNVTIADILAVNPLITDPNNLIVGLIICIPTEVPTPPEECEGVTYTIRAGDTLYALARRANITVAELLAVNPQITDPDNLIVGMIICIPREVPTPPEECEGETYTVRAGDTLFGIARRFNVTVSEILAVNPLITDPNNLVIGMNICIPVDEPACTGRTYAVRPGDTLASISQRFRVRYQALLDANPQITNPNQIFIGQIICIPARS